MGKVYKYGDDVNTDVIFPGKYTYTISDPNEMAQHALEDLDPEFSKTVQAGDFVVAGKNFGCGSSREQAATCIKMSGVDVIIAKSYARIFYRNAINSGIAAVTTDDVDKLAKDDEIEVDLEGGVIHNKTQGTDIRFKAIPPFMMGILKDGGLVPHIKKQLEKA